MAKDRQTRKTMEPHAPRPARRVIDDWCLVVGNFIINFAALDERLWIFLQDKLPAEDFAGIAKRHFVDRLQLARNRHFAAEPEAGRFAAFEIRLTPIRELRNHVAHGHFFIRHDEDPAKTVLTLRQSRDVTHDDGTTRPLALNDLIAADQELSALMEEFTALCGLPACLSLPPANKPEKSGSDSRRLSAAADNSHNSSPQSRRT